MIEKIIHVKSIKMEKMPNKYIAFHTHVRDLLMIPGVIIAVLIAYSIPWASFGTFMEDTLQFLIFSGTGSG